MSVSLEEEPLSGAFVSSHREKRFSIAETLTLEKKLEQKLSADIGGLIFRSFLGT